LRQHKTIDRDKRSKKIGAAEMQAGRFARLLNMTIPAINEETFQGGQRG
jgi:hypothetical protein